MSLNGPTSEQNDLQDTNDVWEAVTPGPGLDPMLDYERNLRTGDVRVNPDTAPKVTIRWPERAW